MPFFSNNMRTAIVTAAVLARLSALRCAPLAGPSSWPVEKWRRLGGPGNSLRALDLIETHVADVTDDAPVEQLFDAVVERYGRLALLFNNAGINVPGYISINSARESFGRTFGAKELCGLLSANIWTLGLMARRRRLLHLR